MMKYLINLFIIFGLVVVLSGCGQKAVEEGSKTSEVPSENLESVSFKIDGFTWVSCAFTVSSAVSNLEGIQDIEVEGSGETQLIFDKSKTSLEEIEEIITDLGYNIRK